MHGSARQITTAGLPQTWGNWLCERCAIGRGGTAMRCRPFRLPRADVISFPLPSLTPEPAALQVQFPITNYWTPQYAALRVRRCSDWLVQRTSNAENDLKETMVFGRYRIPGSILKCPIFSPLLKSTLLSTILRVMHTIELSEHQHDQTSGRMSGILKCQQCRKSKQRVFGDTYNRCHY